jgi:hypothetical protein
MFSIKVKMSLLIEVEICNADNNKDFNKSLLHIVREFLKALHSKDRGADRIENTVLLLLLFLFCSCVFIEPLLSNGERDFLSVA